MNKPMELSETEWEEVVETLAMRWVGRRSGEGAMSFAEMLYAAKFRFQSDFPPYDGDLYVVHGNYFGAPMLVLRRRDGKLVAERYVQTSSKETN